MAENESHVKQNKTYHWNLLTVWGETTVLLNINKYKTFKTLKMNDCKSMSRGKSGPSSYNIPQKS